MLEQIFVCGRLGLDVTSFRMLFGDRHLDSITALILWYTENVEESPGNKLAIGSLHVSGSFAEGMHGRYVSAAVSVFQLSKLV